MATDSKHPGGKPFTPSLSSKFRSAKNPLTPRLAGSAPDSPASAPRRDAVFRSTPPLRAKEAAATPVTATTTPLNGNITPRSGDETPIPVNDNKFFTAGIPQSQSITSPKPQGTSVPCGDQPVSAGHESPGKPPFVSLSPNTVSSRSASLTSSSFATSIASEVDRLEAHKLFASEVDRLEAHKLSESTVPDGAIASILAPPFEPSTPASSELPSVQNDVAATARRERKVLDLEISNSSLLAINKTLERELRKQTVELRRFRRLTRSGRLSIAPADRTVSSSTLGTVPELFDEDYLDFDQGDDATDLDEDDNLSANSGDPLSPAFKASQRARDEKRLLLNLSKHQQMLVDSQKLTQSIRRCLTCSEELIREANKAIDYRVGIGDVNLGGRVLSTDELESPSAEAEPEAHCSCPRSQGLLGPGIDTTTSTELTEPMLQIGNATTTSTAKPVRDGEDKVLTVAVERLFQDLLHGP
ncbi:hypothetical protein DV737_g4523, partial [Chaetothyriales sp. CBS 132003]